MTILEILVTIFLVGGLIVLAILFEDLAEEYEEFKKDYDKFD